MSQHQKPAVTPPGVSDQPTKLPGSVMGRPRVRPLGELQLQLAATVHGELAEACVAHVNSINKQRLEAFAAGPKRLSNQEQINILLRYGNVYGRQLIREQHAQLKAQRPYVVADLVREAVAALVGYKPAEATTISTPKVADQHSARGSAKLPDYARRQPPPPEDDAPTTKPKRRARSAG